MTAASAEAVTVGDERGDVTGGGEVIGSEARVGQSPDGRGSVAHGTAAICQTKADIHGLGIGGAGVALVAHWLASQLEPGGNGRIEGHGGDAAADSGDKVDGRWGDKMGSHDQISFIFPIGIIHNDHKFAILDVGNDRGDGLEW